jgi:hypothetical protein
MGWSASDELWREGLLKHETLSQSDFLEWAKDHRDAAHALGWSPGTRPEVPPEDDYSFHGYFAYPPKMWTLAEWFLSQNASDYVRLSAMAGWPSFVGLQRCSEDDRGFMDHMWDHPHADLLLFQVDDHELPRLFKDMESALWPLQFENDKLIPYQKRLEKIGPFMDLLAHRMENISRSASMPPAIQMGWEHLLNEIREHLSEESVRHHWRSPASAYEGQRTALPWVFDFRNNSDQRGFAKWALTQEYARQSSVWKEALWLLSGKNADAQPDIATWREWLIQQGPEVVKLKGFVANRPEGIGLMGLVEDFPDHYHVWLELGLPSVYPKGAMGWHRIRDQSLPEG